MRLLFIVIFFFNDTATTEIYTLSLHDALPISLACPPFRPLESCVGFSADSSRESQTSCQDSCSGSCRSEEHTSELQSPCNLVCRLLLEKKKSGSCIADPRGRPGRHRMPRHATT